MKGIQRSSHVVFCALRSTLGLHPSLERTSIDSAGNYVIRISKSVRDEVAMTSATRGMCVPFNIELITEIHVCFVCLWKM